MIVVIVLITEFDIVFGFLYSIKYNHILKIKKVLIRPLGTRRL